MGYGREIDGVFRNPCNLPNDSNVIEIETDVRLFAKDLSGHQNEDVVMFQSPQTVDLVMRVLYSAVKLKPQLEKDLGPAKAKEFYENLEINLRFYKNADGKWAYMGANRADGPTSQDLLDTLRALSRRGSIKP